MNFKSFFSALATRHWKELGRFWRNNKWERTDDGGILVGFARISGVYECEAPDGFGIQTSNNLLTTEGCNYLLSVGVAGGTQYSTFYIAPFGGNVAVADTLSAANFATTQTELTNSHYSETTRVAFVESIPTAKSTNNTASPATITAATTSVNVYGLGLLSTSTKSATTGILLSAVNYSPVRSLAAVGDTLGIKYTLTLSN